MKIHLFILSTVTFLTVSQTSLASDCQSLVNHFIINVKPNKSEALRGIVYSPEELSVIERRINELQFSAESKKIIFDSLNYHQEKVSVEKISLYLEYCNTFRGQEMTEAILDLGQLGQREEYSLHTQEFEKLVKSLPQKYFWFKNDISFEDFSSLYFSCKSSVPNAKNNIAKSIYSRFSLGLTATTIGASYAYHNRHNEKNATWFGQMAYEVTYNSFTSYLASKIQTNPRDTQLTKSLKSYLQNRVMGLADIGLYPALFPDKKNPIKKSIEELKNDAKFAQRIKELHRQYDQRGLYNKFKESIINSIRKMIENKESIVVGDVKWDQLTEKDLDNPEVQEVLVLAATVSLYEANRGPYFDTGDIGVDRYVFNSLYSLVTIPRNMAQSYINYQILCMNQNNLPKAITSAVLFTTSVNFMMSQFYYNSRKVMINN